MDSRTLLIIKCGDTIPELVARKGDFEDWIAAGAGVPGESVRTVNVERDDPLPPADTVSGVIVSGSHAMVTEHRPWSERAAAWLADAVGRVPILGICYGHQLLGYALGGTVADNPNGREMGMVDIAFKPVAESDPLLGPFGASIRAPVSHRQSLIELPPGAVHLASSDRDPHQAFRYGAAAWGVQFHPEFDAEVTAAYIDFCAGDLLDEGQDPEALRQGCTDTPAGGELLRRFVGLTSRKTD